MKMLIDTDKMYKLNLTPEGQLSINLSNGKVLQGTLTQEEQDVVATAMTRISENFIQFEPKPTDYIALHLSDIETLEKQSQALEELRVELDQKKGLLAEQIEAAGKLQATLDETLKELDDARPKLRDTSLVVQEQASQLAQLRAELATANEVIQKQREVISKIEIPAGELPKEEAVSLPDNTSGLAAESTSS
jgi:chromosome segregation ATPase